MHDLSLQPLHGYHPYAHVLIQLLRRSNRILRPKGMGACKLVKNEAMLGRLPLTVRYLLVQSTSRTHYTAHSASEHSPLIIALVIGVLARHEEGIQPPPILHPACCVGDQRMSSSGQASFLHVLPYSP